MIIIYVLIGLTVILAVYRIIEEIEEQKIEKRVNECADKYVLEEKNIQELSALISNHEIDDKYLIRAIHREIDRKIKEKYKW